MSNQNLKIVIAMARSYNELFRNIEKNIQQFGLTVSEFGVLEFLYHKGDQPVQKIAEKILVTSGTVTYVIDKLQKMGFVERRKCENDKRVFYVSLTVKGQVFISDIFPKHEAFLDELMKDLNEEAKINLVDRLNELQESIS